MDSIIGKAGKRLFAKHLEHYAPTDPLYETYTNEKGQAKRRRRTLPPGLSTRDARILKSVQKRAHHLDKGFQVCGFRFGWTFFIGIVPGVGDITNLTLNHFLVVRKAKQADIPPWLLRRMQINNVVSTGVGFVPLVGDVIVAVFKANSRNAALLEEFLRIRGEEFLKLHPEALNAADNEGGGRGRWARIRGKRPNPKDVAQVKPGAGMTPGEMTSEIMPGGGDPRLSSVPENNSSDSGNGPTMTSAATNGTSSSLRKNRKRFSLLGNNKKSTSPPRPSSKGRFVEVDSEGRPERTT